MITGWIEESYRIVAPKKLAALLADAGRASGNRSGTRGVKTRCCVSIESTPRTLKEDGRCDVPCSRSLAASAALLVTAAPALACGGLIGPNGAVNLLRTTTFAGYHDGVEHYVTSFEFAGGGGAFGCITPLPGIPTDVERGGDWTLQRLIRETDPVPSFAFAARRAAADSATREAEVLLETTIDALDITILRGGGDEVGLWAKNHGFRLPPDAPEVLDFYADRSPIFMAAAFDADAAAERGQAIGDGTPVHLTIPTDNPWVPLRILGLGKAAGELVEADVYLLTDEQPALLPERRRLRRVATASSSTTAPPRPSSLLADLRSDVGMEWVPDGRVADEGRGRVGGRRPATSTWRSTRPGPGGRRPIDAGYAPFGTDPAPRSPVGALPAARGDRERSRVPLLLERVGAAGRRATPPLAGRMSSPRHVARWPRRCSWQSPRSPAARPDGADGDDHDPLLRLRPDGAHGAGRRADHVRPRQRGPDRPRVAHRRRGFHEAHRTGTHATHGAVPTEVTVPALETVETTITFDEPGTLAYICHLPGHEAYGMVGALTVAG